MFKTRRFWIIIALILAATGGGGYYYYSAQTATAQTAADEPALQSSPVRQGEIIISATGAATVIPATEIAIGFQTSGILELLNVQVGDTVNAGDVLAQLDQTDALQALANAELQLNQALVQNDAAATQTGVSLNDISVQQAQLDLQNAQTTLNDLLNWEPDPDEIAVAEANLTAAQASLNSVYASQASATSSITQAEINLTQAQRSLAEAQESYENAYSEGREWEVFYDEPICDAGEQEPCSGQTWADRIANDRESADSRMIQAQESLTIAQVQYDAAVASSGSNSSASAQTSILSAELALEAAQTGPTEDEIEAAEQAVTQAELALQQTMLNIEIDALSLEQVKLNLAAAQTTLEQTTLTAPIDGTIMTIANNVGEQVASGTFITLADLQQPMIELYLDESDLDNIGVGYEIEVVFDALPDDVFTGAVIQVDPQLSTTNNVSTVRAIAQLNTDSFAKPQGLPVGLNGTVEVIGGRATNALLVPVEALREVGVDQYGVFVQTASGELELRTVEVGLMDFTYAEILSGLEMGETVSTGIVATN